MALSKRLVLLGVLVTLGGMAFANMQVLGKEPLREPMRHHPIEALMSGPRVFEPSTGQRGVDGNRLLVLLVEFQPDEDARTTGDGRFLTAEDAADYPISLGSPPHDKAFFELQCEAMRNYWLAGSHGYFDLEYEVWPQSGYYTLPHEMAWYNPPGVGSSTLIERFEAYFTDVLTIADADPNLTLGDFDHYMVIHAGADWQHDIMGNSPADMPSFFISVGDGKEVTVDDGATVIRHLCNVPEMISQDPRFTEANGRTYVDGYGVINAVMAHEFGHSLGLPDLYNSLYMRPMVGYWDIMDSGGSTLLNMGVDTTGDDFLDTVYSMEGPVAALPGAWSRTFLWGDEMRADGLLRDITSLDLNEKIGVIAAGDQTGALEDNQAYVVKIPLNDREYVLLENRQTDHDDDGPTTLVSDNVNDPRVVLYPTGWNNYIADEYDYALPGWPGPDDRYYGGGLVAWHVNDRVMFDEGSWSGDEFISNFDANIVNTDYDARGVSIIEADGLFDIGNINSMYWEGTVYEPFFPLLPTLDSDGLFANWSIEPFATELSADSDPPLESVDGQPSLFAIYDIDGEHYHRPFHVPPRELTFRCRLQMFDGSLSLSMLDVSDNARLAWNDDPSFLHNNALSELAVFDNGKMTTFTHIVEGEDESWDSPLGAQEIGIATDWPVAVGDFRTDIPGGEFLLADGVEMGIVRSPNLAASHTFGSPGVSSPMIYEDMNGVTVSVYPAVDSLYVNFGNEWLAYPLPNAKPCSDRSYLYAFSQGRLWLILPDSSFDDLQYVDLPFDETPYEPVALLDPDNTADSGVYLQNAQGDIWRAGYGAGKAEQIFRMASYSAAQPTQLALGASEASGAYITFGAGERVFRLSPLGKLINGYPVTIENHPVAPLGFPRVVAVDGEVVVYMPARDGGWLAVDDNGLLSAYSMTWPGAASDDLLFWEEESARLYFASMVAEGSQARPMLSWMDEQFENPIVWGGFRNDGSGGLLAAIGGGETPVTQPLEMSAFPNPCNTGEVRIRVAGASGDIEVKVYDITGSLVYDRGNIDIDEPIRWDVTGVSSGAYFAVVRANDAMGHKQTRTLRIAVIH